MPEAMCEMPVLWPQVMFDGSPSRTCACRKDYSTVTAPVGPTAEMRGVIWTWDRFLVNI